MNETLTKYCQLAAILLGGLTPAVVLAGYVYHLGVILTFGLDPSLVNRGFADVITESWYMGLLFLGYLLTWWWLPVLLVTIFALVLLGLLHSAARLKAKGVEIFPEITKGHL